MASTKEYLDFVMEQLSGLDEVSSRRSEERRVGKECRTWQVLY